MKWISIALIGCVGLTLPVSPAAAQDPTITVYFDEGLTQRTMDCPGPGLDTLYVVAEGFNRFLIGFEYKIDYPPSMVWLADLDVPPVTIGTTPTGISLAFPLPLNGSFPVLIHRVLILWNCVDCSATNDPVSVVPHPIFGFVRATDWPGINLVNAEGRTAVVCQHVDLDIKPQSCPNAFNIKLFEFADDAKLKKGGVLPVAIVGSPTFDVSQIDVSTILLEGVAPLSIHGGPKISDVATPVNDDSECACTTEGPDGIPDLKMKFRAQDIAAAIAPGMLGDRELTLTGALLDGLPFEARDCIRIVGRAMPPVPIPEGTVLNPAYPNPFNPVTRVSYLLPETQSVRLAVYDVSGALVDVLVDGVRDAGEHILEWDATGLASGVYFLHLETSRETLVRRVTLLK